MGSNVDVISLAWFFCGCNRFVVGLGVVGLFFHLFVGAFFANDYY
jgi:hypothetical protein